MPIAPATHLVSDVLTAVKRQFGDESGAQLQDSDIIRWINEGQLEIARQQGWSQTTATTATVAGQASYSLPGVNIINIDTLMYTLQGTTNPMIIDRREFKEIQELLLSKTAPADTAPIAQPMAWYVYAESVFLYPAPANTGDTITLYCTTQPAAVAVSTDAIATPDVYYKSLLNYVMAQAYELDDDWTGAQLKQRELKDGLTGLEEDYGGHRYYPVVVVLDEDA